VVLRASRKAIASLERRLGQVLISLPRAGSKLYSIVQAVLPAPIPDSMSYAEATVFPLCLCTAACGLFQKDHLALQHATVPPKPSGKTRIVWGGASAVGSNGIQLAVAGGHEVFTTASPKILTTSRSLARAKFLITTAKPLSTT